VSMSNHLEAASMEEYSLLTNRDVRGILRIRIAFGSVSGFLLALAAFLGYESAYEGTTHSGAWGARWIGLVPPSGGAALVVGSGAVVAGLLSVVLFVGLRRFFGPPITGISLGTHFIDFIDYRARSHRLDFRDSRAKLIIDTYPQLRFENIQGHWGYCRIVRGPGVGVCQFDEVVLDRIVALAESHGFRVDRSRRTTMEGPSERLRLWLNPKLS
jgi:hypothetical protein